MIKSKEKKEGGIHMISAPITRLLMKKEELKERRKEKVKKSEAIKLQNEITYRSFLWTVTCKITKKAKQGLDKTTLVIPKNIEPYKIKIMEYFMRKGYIVSFCRDNTANVLFLELSWKHEKQKWSDNEKLLLCLLLCILPFSILYVFATTVIFSLNNTEFCISLVVSLFVITVIMGFVFIRKGKQQL